MKIFKKDQKLIAAGLIVAVISVVVGVLIFSNSLETLDVKAEELGSEDTGIWAAPFPDYVIAGLENQAATILLGIASTAAIFAVALGVAMLLKKSKGPK